MIPAGKAQRIIYVLLREAAFGPMAKPAEGLCSDAVKRRLLLHSFCLRRRLTPSKLNYS